MYKNILASILSLCLPLSNFTLGIVEASVPQDTPAGPAAPLIPNDQLDSLVAPIALYPDPLLSQVLVASTYPLEIIQLQQWLDKHRDLKGEALVAAVEKEDWDPSIQAMAALPDAVKRLAQDVKWTTDLGNAFLAQQGDVMDAVQRMRLKADAAGNLKSNEQMKVETKVVETKTVVIIQPANPQIIYVPSYNPVVVYGPPVYMYPYPPIYYPPPSYYAAGVVFAFGVGVAVGSYYRGGWGYYPGWGRHTTININVNNRYVKHYNTVNVNRNINNVNVNRGTNSNWQHNPQHRGAAPYSNKQVAKTYGGTTGNGSASTRQANARQQPSATNRAATGADRPTANAGTRPNNYGTAAANRPASPPGASAGNAGANRPTGTANTIGNRQIPAGDSSKNKSAFGGTSSKVDAQATGARGASSTGTSRSTGSRPARGGASRK
jgi:hypothetical protein